MKGILWGVLTSPLPVTPMYEEGKPHHITLAFNVEKAKYEDCVGSVFTAQLISHLYDENIQAITVQLPSNIPFELTVPHITVSYRKGIYPVSATQMITGNPKALPIPIPVVECVIRFESFNKE